MFVIVGLGNPGKKYDGTKHNIGFEVIDYLSREYNISVKKIKFKGLYGEGNIGGKKVVLLKPQTYMNLSGESVREILKYYNVSIENLLVIYDDIDIDVGKIRIRKKGSAGSHNGMKNIIYQLKDDSFPRIRIGVGKPERMDLADYVLTGFKKDQIKIMEEAVEKSALAVETFIKDDIDLAMNKYNG